MEEKTLVLIKPDAVEKDVWFEIMQLYLNNGFRICRSKILTLDRSLAERFYAKNKKLPYFQESIEHAISGLTIALIISGEDVIQRVRELNGATNPANAREGTIRYKYGEPDSGPRNAVHGSDSKEDVTKEETIIFGEKSLSYDL